MYTVSVRREFIARHFLVGGDWGRENSPHAHHYVLEVKIKHDQLDQHGYLLDIVDIESGLDTVEEIYRDKMLNELQEFEGLNPSLEHFARIIWEKLVEIVKLPGKGTLTIKLWENESCYAAYKQEY
jgi:6-pyruvoyltetrahydropterin/6-carboxytetrahydropterin synthase